MSHYHPETPPSMYDTSVSSRGESSISWSSSIQKTRQNHQLPNQTLPMTNFSKTSPNGYVPNKRLSMEQDEQLRHQEFLYRNTEREVAASWTGGRLSDIGVERNIASAVSRYTSNLYNTPSSSVKSVAYSESGANDRIKSYANRLGTDARKDHLDIGRSAVASPQIPYDEAAATTQAAKDSSTNEVLPPENNIRERIRRLQQRNEERQKGIVGMKGEKSNFSSTEKVPKNQSNRVSISGSSENPIQRKTPDFARRIEIQQPEHSSHASSKINSFTESIPSKHCQTKEYKPREQQGKEYNRRGSSQQQLHYTDRETIKSNNSPLINRAVMDNTPQQNMRGSSSRCPNEAIDRQRSKSLPPVNRYRSYISPIKSKVIPTHFNENESNCDDEEVIYSSKLRQMQHQGGRVAEIETPSAARVRDLRNKLWSPNEHLLVSVRPSLHEEIDDDGSIGRRLSSDAARKKFNRHWLHYNGPEMAGPRGQRIARSLSPKNRDQRAAMYLEAQQDQEQGFMDNRKPTSREQKSLLFKSRYYEAAQRGLTNVSPGRSISTKDTKTIQSQKSWESLSKHGSIATKDSRSTRDFSTTKEKSVVALESTPKTAIANERIHNSRGSNDTNDSANYDRLNNRKGKANEKMIYSTDKTRDPVDKNTTATKMSVRGNSETKEPLDESYKQQSPLDSVKNNDSVASLIAKLGAVQRDNPEIALAQIDAILRTERSRGGSLSETTGADLSSATPELSSIHNKKSIPTHEKDAFNRQTNKDLQQSNNAATESEIIELTPLNDKKYDLSAPDKVEGFEETSDDDDSFFDETTVSSITNPTYHTVSTKPIDHEVKFNSLSASGYPRQSNLQAYSKANSLLGASPISDSSERHLVTPSSSENNNKRESYDAPGKSYVPGTQQTATTRENSTSNSSRSRQRNRSPPPGSINVAVNHRITPNRSEGSINEVSSQGDKKNKEIFADSDVIEKSHSTEIENKIRRWDKLSTGLVPNASSEKSDAKQQNSLPNPVECSSNTIDGSDFASSREYHPWNSSTPSDLSKVDVKDTSMDSADGIEATFASLTEARGLTPSPDRSGISPVRRMRKELINQEMQQIKEEVNNSVSIGNEDEDNGGGSYPWQNENTKAMSDDFDAAWVSLPSSSFFQSKKMHSSDISSRDAYNTYSAFVADGDEVVIGQTRRQQKSLEQKNTIHELTSQPRLSSSSAQTRPFESMMPTPDPIARNVTPTIKNTSHVAATTASSHATKIRGLRGFLKRKGTSARTSTSTEQGSYTSATTPYQIKENILNDNDIAHSNYKHTVASEVANANRGRSSDSKSTPPTRGRAKSADDRRFRSPSIARKFSQLMKVYDTEKETPII